MSSEGVAARVTVVFYRHSDRWAHRAFVTEAEAERFTAAMGRFGVPTEVRFCAREAVAATVAATLAAGLQSSG